jgi:hypothetical protein
MKVLFPEQHREELMLEDSHLKRLHTYHPSRCT